MNKYVIRLPVLLLLPCLITDPCTASGFADGFSPAPQIGGTIARFDEQALMLSLVTAKTALVFLPFIHHYLSEAAHSQFVRAGRQHPGIFLASLSVLGGVALMAGGDGDSRISPEEYFNPLSAEEKLNIAVGLVENDPGRLASFKPVAAKQKDARSFKQRVYVLATEWLAFNKPDVWIKKLEAPGVSEKWNRRLIFMLISDPRDSVWEHLVRKAVLDNTLILLSLWKTAETYFQHFPKVQNLLFNLLTQSQALKNDRARLIEALEGDESDSALEFLGAVLETINPEAVLSDHVQYEERLREVISLMVKENEIWVGDFDLVREILLQKTLGIPCVIGLPSFFMTFDELRNVTYEKARNVIGLDAHPMSLLLARKFGNRVIGFESDPSREALIREGNSSWHSGFGMPRMRIYGFDRDQIPKLVRKAQFIYIDVDLLLNKIATPRYAFYRSLTNAIRLGSKVIVSGVSEAQRKELEKLFQRDEWAQPQLFRMEYKDVVYDLSQNCFVAIRSTKSTPEPAPSGGLSLVPTSRPGEPPPAAAPFDAYIGMATRFHQRRAIGAAA